MKLYNSILPFKNTLECLLTPQIRNKLTVHLLGLKQNKSIKCYKTAFRFNLWHSLNQQQKDKIISASIPQDQWVGGYAEYNDEHLSTLLKKVIDINFIIQCETGMIVNKNKLLSEV